MTPPSEQDRPGQEARFLAAWSSLLLAGAVEADVLDLLAGEAEAEDLRRLAGECARGLRAGLPLAPIVNRRGEGLSFWLQVLLGGERRPAPLLAEAADLLLRAEPWRPAVVWTKLRLLHGVGAVVGEALGAVAREARDQERGALAEALYRSARAARSGAGWKEALQAGSFAPRIQLALLAIGDEGQVARALSALERLPEGRAEPSGEPAPARPGISLESLAQRAQETAGPLRRGLERVISGLEDRLGIDRPGPRPEELARQAVEERAVRDEPAPAAPEAAAPEAVPASPPAASGSRKTIGPDSGPVRVGSAVADAERWVLTFDEARAKLAIIEVQPAETAIAAEVKADLRVLRSELRGPLHSPERDAKLAELEDRYQAWLDDSGEGTQYA